MIFRNLWKGINHAFCIDAKIINKILFCITVKRHISMFYNSPPVDSCGICFNSKFFVYIFKVDFIFFVISTELP